MKKRIIIGFLLLMTAFSFAQIDKMREQLDDSMVEEEDGLLSLRIFDAETANPLIGATVEVKGIGEFETNHSGVARFPSPEKDGYYDVTCSKEGYIQAKFSVEIVVGTIFYNRFSMSKNLAVGQIRIVLEWDDKPKDLDAHLVKEGEYHISYRNKKVSDDRLAVLDRDDKDGNGPETITVKQIDKNKKYRFYVHNYSNKEKASSNRLSLSKASIKIYGNDKLLHYLKIPTDTKGLFWNVFEIENGTISVVNSVDQISN